ncbi:helix-turn-helix domain-containing protein [Streptococcus merionis]|uniref:Cro/CI family transcriptional regulator n=1 Tax=Streptococcus merionis TaxID=400065 RepID=A0A239STQ4_9STRE|nr:helix-turn-helix transcriptional regulator [Streptococcus merionis]SNU88800.1 Cro/CI family transcriptional regulator [Streptococcus merionis]
MTHKISISHRISKYRKEKGITQEELANFIGVSKASVSKWEIGHSFPDITFLPQLATYFNISIDELMGYEPQLTPTAIREYYQSLATDFSRKPFEKVLESCQELIKSYYSCYPFLFAMGQLLLNHCHLAPTIDKTEATIRYAQSLFQKIKTESNDLELQKQAIYLEAICLLQLKEPEHVIDLIEHPNTALMSQEILLAQAYQATGQIEQAQETLQIEIYQYFLTLLQLLQTYLSLTADQPKTVSMIENRLLKLIIAFDLEKLHPFVLFPIYLKLAQVYSTHQNIEKVFHYLNEYVRLATSKIFPVKLKGDSFFTKIDGWFNQLPLGTQPPQDEVAVKKSLYDGVILNPSFTNLSENPSFSKLCHRLQILLES